MTAVARQSSPQKTAHAEAIAGFERRYAKALADARRSAQHTDTDGWQQLYADHIKGVRTRRQQLGTQLSALAKGIEHGHCTEEDEKAIGDVKKAATELRAAEQHWRQQVVEPVREPVRVCDRVLEDAMSEARDQEHREPMLHVGLIETMGAAVSAAIRATWDDEAGRVLIHERIDTTTGEVVPSSAA